MSDPRELPVEDKLAALRFVVAGVIKNVSSLVDQVAEAQRNIEAITDKLIAVDRGLRDHKEDHQEHDLRGDEK